MSIIKIRKLKKFYGKEPNTVKALNGIDYEIKDGEFISIVGTSGSGKSTFLHMLAGLDSPTEGKVLIEDKDILEMNTDERTIFRRRNIGIVFQGYNLIPILNVYENINLPLNLDGKKADEEYFTKVVDSLGLKDKLLTFPNNLSGGQQQRVAIARALITKPKFILADEPTGNLDSKTSQDVLSLLKTTKEVFNQTIILVTHNEEIAQLADKCIRIEDGVIVGGGKNDF